MLALSLANQWTRVWIFHERRDPNFPQDSANLGAEWGRSSFDVRHRFSVSFSYDVPFGFGDGKWHAKWASLHRGMLPEIDTATPGRSALGFGANDRPI